MCGSRRSAWWGLLGAASLACGSSNGPTANGIFDASFSPDGTAPRDAGQLHPPGHDSGKLGSDAGRTHAEGGPTGSDASLVLHENPGNLTPSQEASLMGGGHADSSFRWLYPYDATVFPRGIPSPLLQLDGEAATAVYVTITGGGVDYSGFYAGANPTEVTLTSAAWAIVEQGGPTNGPLTVSASKLSASGVSGPVRETWTIAAGSLRGVVYYDTYNSTIADGGATMEVPIGQSATPLLTNCQVCHSVSPDGTKLSARTRQTGSMTDLATNPVSTLTTGVGSPYAFDTFTPDGELYLTGDSSSMPGQGENDYDTTPTLYQTSTGAMVPTTVNSSADMTMPSFSPDGARVVFSNQTAVGVAQTLGILDFDRAASTFSSLLTIASSTTTNLVWPSFTPDGNWVVYNTCNRSDYSSQGTGGGGVNAIGDLYIADATGGGSQMLAEASGYSGTTLYLPYGTAEADLNFDGTLLSEAVGGYFWVVFTSRRCYGNTFTPTTDPDPYAYGMARRKKLWVAAIDVGASLASDPSHPAFLLPGQEMASGNQRGYWALAPCQSDGASCASGDECCGGYCSKGSCASSTSTCSAEYDKCTSASACCDTGSLCINGRCAEAQPK